jgi:NADPH:quinone reductase-like Zn-dependent oxidoreductase
MQAIVYTEFGPPEVLQLEEVEKPVPKDTEVLIKVYATTVGYGDLFARNPKFSDFNMPAPLWLPTKMFFGFSKPKVNILGSVFSGEVESVGAEVTRFKKGDQVFGYLGQKMGAYAEYLCMPEDGVVALKPDNLSHKEATTVAYGPIMALNLLKAGNIQSGSKVLIVGASGGIGSAAVQLAKHDGAEVTGVCGGPRMEFVKSLGADNVIDYRSEDFTQSGESYDLIFDILGVSSFSEVKNSLKENGIYLRSSFKMKQVVQMLWTKITGGKQVVCAMSPERVEDLETVKELVEAGVIKTFIDRTFPLEQAPEAHRYAESGNRTGNIVIAIQEKS